MRNTPILNSDNLIQRLFTHTLTKPAYSSNSYAFSLFFLNEKIIIFSTKNGLLGCHFKGNIFRQSTRICIGLTLFRLIWSKPLIMEKYNSNTSKLGYHKKCSFFELNFRNPTEIANLIKTTKNFLENLKLRFKFFSDLFQLLSYFFSAKLKWCILLEGAHYIVDDVCLEKGICQFSGLLIFSTFAIVFQQFLQIFVALQLVKHL